VTFALVPKRATLHIKELILCSCIPK
jgi:hypothetical protein